MHTSEISKTNKASWEKTAEIHRKLRMEELLTNFNEPGYSLLDKYETSFLVDKIQVKGKDVIQLCCNNARELLSIKNLGARRCVGIDITEGFIQQGKELASVAKKDLELYSMDVFNTPESFHNSFDVCYITVGAIIWLADLNAFCKLISKLLRPDGYLLLYDMHPILNMFDSSKDNPVIPKYSYFKTDAFIEEEGYDYFDKTAKIESKTYTFQHTLEDIFMSCLSNGLEIKEFREYKHDTTPNSFELYAKHGYPISLMLLAQKFQSF